MRTERHSLPDYISVLLLFLISMVQAHAQDGTGIIEGRVQNISTGSYANNARVSVERTNIEAFTNQDGEYRLINVPAGAAKLRVTYAGVEPESATVNVPPGAVVRQDFELSIEDIVKLDAFVVEATEASAQASAINEQRVAPNIKNVVAFEEFGNLSDGNIGEYLKYTPGLSIFYGPQTAQQLSIRGMPANATLVMVDGAEIGSPSSDRAFDLATSAAGNVDRVEVTKVPTPDMPANAVGGAVNIIGKSGFSSPKRKISINTYLTYNSLDGVKPPSNTAGSDPGSDRKRIQPGYDLSYTQPVNQSFAFTLNLSGSTRYYDMEQHLPRWNLSSLTQANVTLQHVMQVIERQLAAATIDWKPSKNNSLRFNYQHVMQDSDTRQNNYIAIFGGNAIGMPTSTQGAAAGNDRLRQTLTWGDRTRGTDLASLRFQHNGPRWQFDLRGSISKSWDERKDMEHGFFRGFTPERRNLILRADALDNIHAGRAPRISGTDRTGTPVDPYAADELSIASALSQPNRIDADVLQVSGSIARDFSGTLPLSIKTGGSINRQEKDITSEARTWSFTPPGGAAGRLAKNLDLVNADYSARNLYSDSLQVEWLSPAKMFDLYQAHPEYFTLNEPQAYISRVTNSKLLEETVSAAFVRADLKLLDNRLWIVGGVRYEHTSDFGLGPLNDISATYVRDANGELARNAAGRPIPVTTDPLAAAQLRYTERGAQSDRSYDGFYPSLNTSLSLGDAVVLRAAYARTIGRPPLTQIIPSVTISDPGEGEANRTINVVNSGLRPWSSHNYDLSVEAYHVKGAVITASVFHKDLADFFGRTQLTPTPELLAEFGLSEEYMDYDIVTTRNFGEAKITGLEVSWRQKLHMLPFAPDWTRGMQLFFNATRLRRSGANAVDFNSFSALNINWGVHYVRKRLALKLNVAYSGEVKGNRIAPSAAVPLDTFQNVAPKTTVDLYTEFRLMKRMSIYASVSNLTGEPKRTFRYAPATPDYAKPFRFQDFGTLVTVGLRLDF